MLSLIAAVGKNRELGSKGELIFHIPEDMKFFREMTTGHSVLMGRKTWESLPAKLPDRKNIVVSRKIVDGADESIQDLADFIKKNKDSEEEIFVIGGGELYSQTINSAKTIYLTEVDAEAKADVFFPEFDKTQYNKEVIKKGVKDDLAYSIVKYSKK